jgi:hypothetical protein
MRKKLKLYLLFYREKAQSKRGFAAVLYFKRKSVRAVSEQSEILMGIKEGLKLEKKGESRMRRLHKKLN